MGKLEDTKIVNLDHHVTNNYLKTLCYLLNIAQSQVKEELDTTPTKTKYSNKLDRQEVHVNIIYANYLPSNEKDNYNNKKIGGNKRSRLHDSNGSNENEEESTNNHGDKPNEGNTVSTKTVGK